MIYAFSPEGVACLAAVLASDPLLAFDIDGTLAPIVEHPPDARLPDDVQQGLAQLAQRSPIAVITGRSVADARRMLSFEPRYLIGNHGAEGLPGFDEPSREFAGLVRSWKEALVQCNGLACAGVTVEDKRLSLSLHYRMATDHQAATAAIKTCVDGLTPRPRVIGGKAVVNLLPAKAPDKGDALRALIEYTRCSNVLYVGDDDTDERVFGLHLPSVLTLRVEPAENSAATLFVRDQREVSTLVHHIGRELGPRTARQRPEHCHEP